MSPHVIWAKGGEATIVSIARDSIVLRSSVPCPPGSRVEGTLGGAPSAKLRLKVHASKLQPEGDFLLEGRPLDLTRETLERVGSQIGPAAAPDGPEGAGERQKNEGNGACPLR
jgi:hypothetical protein